MVHCLGSTSTYPTLQVSMTTGHFMIDPYKGLACDWPLATEPPETR
jgi:hypothetical protein